MSDLGENDGGETVFAEAWPPNQLEEDRVDLKSVRLYSIASVPLPLQMYQPVFSRAKQAIRQLRESEQGSMLARGSWEETLVSISTWESFDDDLVS
jgi:hypothetical protein